jgi:imidazolonepropionase-like amidohydrolase
MTRATFGLALTIGAAALAAPQTPQPSNVPALPDNIPTSGTIHSVILLAGSKAGDEVVWKTPDGTTHAFYQYNDRARGPKIDGTYTLSDKGIPTAVALSGLNYLKQPVDERLTSNSASLSWKSAAEQGSKPGREAFYVTADGPAEESAMLVHAAKAHGGTVPLLPTGEARVEKVRAETVTVDGKPQPITLYAITGLSFAPARVWLDADDHFFATPGTWYAQVRVGAEAELPRLLAIEQGLDKARSADLAHKLVKTPAHDLLIHDVTLFDSIAATTVPHQSVLISGNKIAQVGAADAVKPTAGATTIEGNGQTLLPGMWDMHVHTSSDQQGLLNLAAGVTTVRDLGTDADELKARLKRIDAGEEIGPRTLAAGLIDGPGPYQGPTKALVATPDDVRQWVTKFHDLGYVQIKIYSSVKPELVPVVVEEAHKRGMRVSGHIPAGMIASDAIHAGYDEMQHMNFVFLNFMPDVKETRTPARFTEPAKRSADLDLASKPVQDFIGLLAEKHIAFDPTLAAFEGMFLARPGSVDPTFAAIADRLPAQIRRSTLRGGLPVPDQATDTLYHRSFDAWKRMLKILSDRGITIDIGTDSLAGFAYHRELELHTQAGIPATKVLQNATIVSARTMKRDAELGSITVGKLADLVLVPGDPTKDINAIRGIRTTIKDGKVYDAAALYRELGVTPAP